MGRTYKCSITLGLVCILLVEVCHAVDYSLQQLNFLAKLANESSIPLFLIARVSI